MIRKQYTHASDQYACHFRIKLSHSLFPFYGSVSCKETLIMKWEFWQFVMFFFIKVEAERKKRAAVLESEGNTYLPLPCMLQAIYTVYL